MPQVIAEWSRVGVIDEWIEKECPRHTVELAAYRMMRYPVTNLEYRRFLEETGAPWLPTSWTFGVYPLERANHPVWSVPAEAADAYAAWLCEATGRRFRLPTEAEWEYAASGGADVEYPWGDAFDPRAANTVEAGPLSTTPVGIFPLGRSAFGIDDLAGNVEEYVADDYRPYPGGEAIADDLAVTQGGYRIARGGSFTRFGDLALRAPPWPLSARHLRDGFSPRGVAMNAGSSAGRRGRLPSMQPAPEARAARAVHAPHSTERTGRRR